MKFVQVDKYYYVNLENVISIIFQENIEFMRILLTNGEALSVPLLYQSRILYEIGMTTSYTK